MNFISMETLANILSKGPFLGIDWGKRRIGVALSDPENHMALPLKVFQNVSYNKIFDELKGVWDFYSIQALIVGCPFLEGHQGKSEKAIRRFCQMLPNQWPICLWDESLTTEEALERTSSLSKSGKISFSKSLFPHHSASRYPVSTIKKSRSYNPPIDHHAAAVILSDALYHWRFLRQQQERNIR